jgi:hypothetical protein
MRKSIELCKFYRHLFLSIRILILQFSYSEISHAPPKLSSINVALSLKYFNCITMLLCITLCCTHFCVWNCPSISPSRRTWLSVRLNCINTPPPLLARWIPLDPASRSTGSTPHHPAAAFKQRCQHNVCSYVNFFSMLLVITVQGSLVPFQDAMIMLLES